MEARRAAAVEAAVVEMKGAGAAVTVVVAVVEAD